MAASSQPVPEMGRSGVSQYWQPANPSSAPSRFGPGSGPLGLTERQAEADDSTLLSSQSSVRRVSFPQSQFGVGHATLSQPQSSLAQSLAPQADLNQAVPTQDRPSVGQTMFSREAHPSVGQTMFSREAQPGVSQTVFSREAQPGVGQTMFSREAQPGVGQSMLSREAQPGVSQTVFSQPRPDADKIGRSEDGVASAAFFHQTRSSQPSADQLGPCQPGTDRTLSGAAHSNSSEYHLVVNDQSPPYFQQLCHGPQPRVLASQYHAQGNIRGTAAENNPNYENCAPRSAQPRPATKVTVIHVLC